MLLQFSVNNFKSIKDTITLSMLSSKKAKKNTSEIRNYSLVNSCVIYGANASGKSNILKAMSFMTDIILNKTKVIQSTDHLPHDPFKLNSSTQNASSTFEIIFFINDIKYRYGFEIDKEVVYSEWLYEDKKGKESKLFFRDTEDDDYVNQQKFKEGYSFFSNKKAKIKISPNQLFLWVCDRVDDSVISKNILHWFSNFNFIDGLNDAGYINYTMSKMNDSTFKQEMVNLIKTADIGIEDVRLEENEITLDAIERMNLPIEIKDKFLEEGVLSLSLNTYHKKYDENDKEIGSEVFELEHEESIGTRKFFKLSAPILNTLKQGRILMIDELDASLHPILTHHLIKLFNDKNINKNNAQLIFTTHDTNLLKPHIFERDQIWFTEKDKYGSTTFYSILEIKGVRENEDFEKQYIQGKYGAIPYLGKFEF